MHVVLPEHACDLHKRRNGSHGYDTTRENHRHSGIGLHTPASVHHGTAHQIRQLRQQTLDAAYTAHPDRFGRRRPHPPKLPDQAWINQPSREALIQSV